MGISLKVLSALFLLALLTSEFVDCEVFEDDEPAEERSKMLQKRGSVDFGVMIWKVTRRNPLDYNGYGCYCGFGGKGRPLDAIDRCCKAHDKCWDRLTRKKICTRKMTVGLPYNFKRGRCVDIKSIFTGRMRCKGRGWWRSCSPIYKPFCPYHLCRCDLKAARCFKRNNRYYNPRNTESWQKSKC
ncbi:phospholipase A2 A2-actitoxin-Cgg2a [Exaiptasia diaphana]|uniref:Phospholipase A2 n=1 Tax=Exaiptasia diaphana TaxID=2652724 RepID=A0A913XWR3_EXADI|nr:phospholipase A2 A2-actitoxin-Cgg2a [Exaiptasia diaphana]